MEHSANEPNQIDVDPEAGGRATVEEVEPAPTHAVDAAEWRRALIEVLADAEEPLSLREIRKRAGELLGAPAPPAMQEQMESLRGLGHVERTSNQSTYAITEQGRWLVEGNRVLHG